MKNAETVTPEISNLNEEELKEWEEQGNVPIADPRYDSNEYEAIPYCSNCNNELTLEEHNDSVNDDEKAWHSYGDFCSEQCAEDFMISQED